MKTVWFSVFIVLLGACQKKSLVPRDLVTDNNLVNNENASVKRMIGDDNVTYAVMGEKAVRDDKKDGGFLPPTDQAIKAFLNSLAIGTAPANFPQPTPPANDSLVLGYPVTLIPQYQAFGGVITSVSDKKNKTLGLLKLADLPPVHVRGGIVKDKDDKFALTFFGCVTKCAETSKQLPLVQIPIVGVDADKKFVFINLSSLGEDLNLVKRIDPDGDYTQLKTKSSKTVLFDFSLSTLVFDVEIHMIPKDGPEDAPETIFTARWYLRLTSTFNPAFEPRPQSKEVGFFLTDRALSPKITRFSRYARDGVTESKGHIKYFIKNVPTEYRSGFAAAFDEWNQVLADITGEKMLDYQFIENTDSIHKLLVAGDVRYNIVEWDIDNLATYGGLGPSIANQYTGEIFSANTLIQGPTILEIYKKWFKVSAEVTRLKQSGLVAAADKVLLEWKKSLPKADRTHFNLRLGAELPFRIVSTLPSFEDPIAAKDSFDPVPAGYTFETYIHGYFVDMVAHELGHNLGLRHNFRGNLASDETAAPGKVSNSIMEYLGKLFRHHNHIGDYDRMAIRYGYAGQLPDKRGLYCTDEDVVSPMQLALSAECSRDDATKDPFSYFEKRLARAISLLVARGSCEASEWKTTDMDRELATAILGLGYYGTSANSTAANWTNFFGIGDRPAKADEVKPYTVRRVKMQICSAELLKIAADKESESAIEATLQNILDLRNYVGKILPLLGVGTAVDYTCK